MTEEKKRTRTWKAGTLTKADQTGEHGFTLIEMMVVLMLIAIVAAVVVPRMGALEGANLKSSARNVAGAVRITYATAIVNKKPYRICFDLEDQTFSVEEKSGDEYVKAKDSLLGSRALPENIYFKKIEVMDRTCEDWCKEYLYFSPGGYVEEAAIYLTTEDGGRNISVFTKPMIGRAEIVLGEVAREEWEESRQVD